MILRFAHILCNTIFPSRFEHVDENGNVEMIRLIEGSNEVIESKQPKTAREKRFTTGYANVREGDEVFYQTEVTDKSIIEFLKKTSYWGTLINEYDPLAESKARAESAAKQIDVMKSIVEMKDDQLLALGYASLGKKALQYAKDKNINQLRVDLYTEAQENPEEINELINDESKADRLFIGLAFAKGTIEETEAGNSISWGHNKSKIINVPKDVLPIDAMLEHFNDPEGKEVKKQIYTLIYGHSSKNTKEDKKKEDKKNVDAAANATSGNGVPKEKTEDDGTPQQPGSENGDAGDSQAKKEKK